ncbi:cAMP-binding domain of CRP or a regulatory subunit of cAMP-dependent protein kinases [Chryseobacterium arachidis]|uniref:cAMP-binding domain of CRP or a regulatory subunit of cAMP-dependent protein kinases n=1 Tax=Chryseobacterium arachidis TaxID=1416778 RepID=A0A1M5I9R8_9FLAO|nr:Crp/Fnr family transcriptional regulator [Chryseobacterium arachidis]SHG24869.1 cAMP-binding domain of CRP or a regulatory subunit of cAMP-dependent protein kinases [Chryseobacterium arachidis]
MLINENLLLQSGAQYEEYQAKDFLYYKGTSPRFYFQIVQGTVELNQFNDSGSEFTFNILSKGHSIGESVLLGNQSYPMNAIAKTDCLVLKLAKTEFLKLLDDNREVAVTLLKYISDAMYHNYIMLSCNSFSDPMSKIKSLLDYHKQFQSGENSDFEVPFTRQQIANMTGLRVETVIRTVKKMQADRIIKLEGRQIVY